MSVNSEKETIGQSLESKLRKSSGTIIAILIVLLVFVVAISVFAAVKSKVAEKGISQIDSISYALTNDAKDLSAEDIAVRQNKAIEDLLPLSNKGGVVGLRANMLLAEIKFAQKNYDEARAAWLKAASAKPKVYTAPLCYFNAAVASEELGDTENAIAYYKNATENEEFLLIDHALFSLGRLNESAQKYEDAKAAYEKAAELHSSSSWANLAKSRVIAMKAAGNIQ